MHAPAFPWRRVFPTWGRVMVGDPLWLLVGIALAVAATMLLNRYSEELLLALVGLGLSVPAIAAGTLGLLVALAVWWLATWIHRWDAERRGLNGPWLPARHSLWAVQVLILAAVMGAVIGAALLGVGVPDLARGRPPSAVLGFMGAGAAIAVLWAWRRLLYGHPPTWRRAVMLGAIGALAGSILTRWGTWLADQVQVWATPTVSPVFFFFDPPAPSPAQALLINHGPPLVLVGAALMAIAFLLALLRLDGDPAVSLAERHRSRRRAPHKDAAAFGA